MQRSSLRRSLSCLQGNTHSLLHRLGGVPRRLAFPSAMIGSAFGCLLVQKTFGACARRGNGPLQQSKVCLVEPLVGKPKSTVKPPRQSPRQYLQRVGRTSGKTRAFFSHSGVLQAGLIVAETNPGRQLRLVLRESSTLLPWVRCGPTGNDQLCPKPKDGLPKYLSVKSAFGPDPCDRGVAQSSCLSPKWRYGVLPPGIFP